MSVRSAKESKRSFIEENPAFVEIPTSIESTTFGGEFQEIHDDEVWLLQCPKGTDIRVLEGQKIKLPGRSHIQEMEAVAVEFSKPLSESFGYCNRKGKYALKLLPLSGSVLLRNRLKANEMATADEIGAICPDPGRVPAPSNIKVRHPLLGHQFEDKLLVESSIVERLRQADEFSAKNMQDIRSKARKRSKTTLKKPEQKKSYKSEPVESENETTTIKLKKHKRDTSTMDVEGEDSSNRKKKKKNSKHAPRENEVSEDLSWLQNL